MFAYSRVLIILFICTPSFFSIAANDSSDIINDASISEAISLFDEGHTDQSAIMFESMKNEPVALSYLAIIALDNALDDAEDYIVKAVKLSPDDASIHFKYGVVMARQAQNSIFSALSYAKKSLSGFKKAVEIEPTKVKYLKGLVSFYLRAPGIAGGNKDRAFELINAIKALDPLEGALSFIEYYWSIDDDKNAMLHVEKSLVTFPKSARLHFMLGVKYQQTEQFSEAVNAFLAASRLNNQSVDKTDIQAAKNSLYQIGKTAVLAQAFVQEGQEALTQYIKIDDIADGSPSVDWAKFRLAELLHLSKRNSEALNLIANIDLNDNDDLRSKVKKLTKQLKKG